jgi:hypothetical protein
MTARFIIIIDENGEVTSNKMMSIPWFMKIGHFV